MTTVTKGSRRTFLVAIGGIWTVAVRAEEPTATIPPFNTMSDEEEIQLGRDAAADLEKSLHFVEQREINDYVRFIFGKIARTSRRPNMPYSIRIVDTKEINAFTLPGGFVYLNRGLLEWAESESQLTATLAHEIGHVAGHHGANIVAGQSTADSLLTQVSQVVLGSDIGARVIERVGGPFAFLALMKYSRDQEAEADLFGYYNMQRAGWHPRGMVEIFHRFGEGSNALDPLFTLTKDHPDPAFREAQITDEMQKYPPEAGLTYDSAAFQAVRAVLKRLPPPAVNTKLMAK